MAKRPTSPAELREAVERTVQATLGSAERQRERTQGALDDLAGTVDQLRRGAEAGLARGRRAIEDRRPATSEDIRELKAELRRIGRRLDEIEERLPAKRSGGGGSKRSASGGRSASGAKRSASGSAKRSASGGRRTS
jgi:chromosome segregation ATPase